MRDEEKLALLQIIRNNQGTIGVDPGDLLTSFTLHSNYPPEITKALIESCIDDGSIKVWKYGNDRYSLSSKGLLWLRDAEFNKNREDLTRSMHEAAQQSAAATKEKKSVRRTVEVICWILGALAASIAIYEFVLKEWIHR